MLLFLLRSWLAVLFIFISALDGSVHSVDNVLRKKTAVGLMVGGYFCSSKLEYEIKVKCLVVLSASQRPHQPVYL